MVAAKQISKTTVFTRHAVMGMLVSLWHDSQILERASGTKDTILAWLDIDADVPIADTNALIAALCECGILSCETNDANHFDIVGNEKHINKMREFKEMASRGGKASGLTRAKRTVEAYGSSESKRAVEHSSIQFNSIQDNTNKKRKRAVAVAPEFDIESVYERYPRKLGKSEGLKRLAREIKSDEDWSALMQAVIQFAKHHQVKSTEEKFIPYFSTWVTSWRDWLSPQSGAVILPTPTSLQSKRESAAIQSELEAIGAMETNPERVRAILDRALGGQA